MNARELLSRIDGWADGPGRPGDRLARALAAAIDAETVPTGTRLPSERQLAHALRVSRGTVVRTYARLRAQGRVHTRHGSGTVVGAPSAGTAGQPVATVLPAEGIPAAAGEQGDGTSIDLRVAAWDADEEVLADLAMPSTAELRDAARGTSGYWPLGLPSLRRALAARMTATGLPTDPEQVIVTNGAQQAVDVVVSALLQPGAPVLVEETSWPGALELLAVRHLRTVTVPEAGRDHVPLIRALRERRADLAYLIPSHHNPTGRVLAAPARRLVLEAAAEGGAQIIDDVTFADLWMDEAPPPPLAAAADPELADRVISVGTLSKPVWGGLRIGWIRARPSLAGQLGRVKTALDLGAPVASQLAAVEVVSRLEPLLERRRRLLAARRDALLVALAEQLPGWRVTPPAGGMSVWAELQGVSGDALAAAAAAHGVRVPPARASSATGRDLDRVRITLSRPEEELRAGVARLARAWSQVRDGSGDRAAVVG